MQHSNQILSPGLITGVDELSPMGGLKRAVAGGGSPSSIIYRLMNIQPAVDYGIGTIEIEFLDSQGANLCQTVGGVASASSIYLGHDPSRAFDGNTGTSDGWEGDEDNLPVWIQFEFNEFVEPVSYNVYAYPSSQAISVSERSFGSWDLQKSTDGETWEDIHSQNPGTFSVGESKSFNITS